MITSQQVKDLGTLKQHGVQLAGSQSTFDKLIAACQGPVRIDGIPVDLNVVAVMKGTKMVGVALPISWHPGGPSQSRMDPKHPEKPLDIKPYLEVHLYLPADIIAANVNWVCTDSEISEAKPWPKPATKKK